jgi:hypothetical protein
MNPTTVESSYAIPDSGAQASLIYPNALDQSDLRLPINQYVSFSLLFDRAYDLWGAYRDDGTPRYQNWAAGNNPQVVGCWADILQLQQYTGQNVDYSPGTGGASLAGTGKKGGANTLAGHQGILQMIPGWVFFGAPTSLHYYGFVSGYNVTVTHWSQFMVPMRCAIDISFTLLPPPSQQNNWASSGGGFEPPKFIGNPQAPSPSPKGRSGR